MNIVSSSYDDERVPPRAQAVLRAGHVVENREELE
jgi:hypothetical protein